jgi:hypothetical protein
VRCFICTTQDFCHGYSNTSLLIISWKESPNSFYGQIISFQYFRRNKNNCMLQRYYAIYRYTEFISILNYFSCHIVYIYWGQIIFLNKIQTLIYLFCFEICIKVCTSISSVQQRRLLKQFQRFGVCCNRNLQSKRVGKSGSPCECQDVWWPHSTYISRILTP